MNEIFTDEELEEAAYLSEVASEKKVVKRRKSLKTFIDPVQFKEDIGVNMVDLNNAFISQASLFAHYGMQSARAAEQHENSKLILETKEAQLNVHHRHLLLDTGVKITEAMVTNAVLTDPIYLKARKLLNEAKGVLEMNKATTEAFRQRRDMLIQLGADAREERKGEMFVKTVELRNSERESSIADLRDKKRIRKNA